MERNQFDALARVLSTKRSRRAAVSALVGTALLGHAPDPVDAQCRGKDGKRKRQCRRKARDQRHASGAGDGVCTWLDQICSDRGNLCCGSTACKQTIIPFLTTCQTTWCLGAGTAEGDARCQQELGTLDVSCVHDPAACEWNTCCRPNACTMRDRPCKDKRSVCCPSPVGGPVCCLPGQQCTKHGCAAST